MPIDNRVFWICDLCGDRQPADVVSKLPSHPWTIIKIVQKAQPNTTVGHVICTSCRGTVYAEHDAQQRKHNNR